MNLFKKIKSFFVNVKDEVKKSLADDGNNGPEVWDYIETEVIMEDEKVDAASTAVTPTTEIIAGTTITYYIDAYHNEEEEVEFVSAPYVIFNGKWCFIRCYNFFRFCTVIFVVQISFSRFQSFVSRIFHSM